MNVVVDEATTGGTQDNLIKGSGDHDVVFTFGNPRACLTLRMQAKLTSMRGYVMDARRGEQGGPADGDLGIDWVQKADGGLWMAAYWRDDLDE